MAQPQSGSPAQSKKKVADKIVPMAYPFKVFVCIVKISETWVAKNRVAPPEMIVEGDDEWNVHFDHGKQQIVVLLRPAGHRNFKLRKQLSQLMSLMGDLSAKSNIHEGGMAINAKASEEGPDGKAGRMAAMLDARRDESRAQRETYAAQVAMIEEELTHVLPPTTFRIELQDIVQGVPQIASEVIEGF